MVFKKTLNRSLSLPGCSTKPRNTGRIDTRNSLPTSDPAATKPGRLAIWSSLWDLLDYDFGSSMSLPSSWDCARQHKDTYYITTTFQAVECIRFMRDPDKEPNTCKCGRLHAQHLEGLNTEVVSDTSQPWTIESCTKYFPTNAYGHINFTKVEADFLPKYLRFSYDTSVAKLSDLLRKKWALPKPYLIMVVIGGLGGMIRESDDKVSTTGRKTLRSAEIEKKQYIDKIRDGLVDAAVSTQAWIITTGLDNGVSKLVGGAVGTRRTFTQTIPTIGIASWGTIRESNKLTSDDAKGSFPADYNVTALSRLRGSKALDVNHTAFLFPDFGTHRNYHVNEMAKLKIEIEKQIKYDTKSNLITILIEGGLSSLIEAGKRVQNKIPIVVMQGTGRAADMIGSAKKIFVKYGQTDCVDFRDELEAQFQEHFNTSYDREEHYDAAFDAILVIVQNKHLVTIWDPDKADEGKIDKAILMGLINSLSDGDVEHVYDQNDRFDSSSDEDCKSDPTTDAATDKTLYEREFLQLELAIKWNRLDLAEEFLFKGKHYTVNQLNALLGIAMEHKEIDFIKSIMAKGASLKRFMTERQFEIFLNSSSNLKCTLLKKLLKRTLSKKHNIEERPHFIYEHFEKVIYDISQGVYKCPRKYTPTKDKEHLLSKRGNLLKEIMNCGAGYYAVKKLNMGKFSKPHKGDDDWEPCFEDPENLLVLYFVLIYEHEIAMTLWKYSRTPLILSLVCAQICKWLAHQEKRRKEITGEHKIQFQKFESEWEDLAIQMVDETAKHYNTKWVQALIKHRFYSWGGRSAMEIADFKSSVKFMGHPGVQNHITNMWMGALSTDTTYGSIILGIFITPICVDFRKYKRVTRHATLGNERKAKQRLEFINQKKGTLPTADEEALIEKESRHDRVTPKILIEKFIMFHRAPVTKYFVNLGLYLIFMAIFVCALTLDESTETFLLKPEDPQDFNILEYIILAWMLSSVPLEIRQVYHSMPSTLGAKVMEYIHNLYNKNDVAALVFLTMAVLIKQGVFIGSGADQQKQMYNTLAYKWIFGITFILSTTRLLQFLQINSRIGPKISMITRMLYDLLFFIAIVAIFIMAYGVATEAIIYPTGRNTTLSELSDIVWRPYIHLFGELYLEQLEGQLNQGYCKLQVKSTFDSTGDNKEYKYDYSACLTPDAGGFLCADDPTCRYAKLLIQFSLMVYMMLAAVLMLNLLIAVFSHTYDEMNTTNDLLWKWQRYDLMMEFKQRSAIPFPLSLLSYLFRMTRWVWRKCMCGGESYYERREAQKHYDEYKRSQISLLERECLRNISETATNKLTAVSGMDDVLREYITSLKSNSDPTLLRSALLSDRPSSGLTYTGRPSVMRSDIPQPIELDDVEVDALLVDAQEMPVMFASPTSPPLNKPRKYSNAVVGIPPNTMYPESSVTRYSVTADKRSWDVDLPGYLPIVFNPDVKETVDGMVTNHSYEGQYKLDKGYPVNPMGRTGIFGRGLLATYGPNHISIPILTRFQNPQEAPSLDTPLEVVVQRSRLKQYGLPEFRSRPDEPLTREFTKMLFDNVEGEKAIIAKHNIKRLLKRGILLKRGLVESPYNTDNAWCEMFIVSYHDDDEDSLRHITFPVDSKYSWANVTDIVLSDPTHAKYFERAVYNRRVSQYIGSNVTF